MDRVSWSVMVCVIITVSVGVVIVWLNGESNSKAIQEQRQSTAQQREQLDVIYVLLTRMQKQIDQLQMNQPTRHAQEQITTNPNEAANVLSKVLREIEINREQCIKPLSTFQHMLQQQKKDAANWHTCQKEIVNILGKQEQHVGSLEVVTEKLHELKRELSTQRDEASKNQNENLKRIQQIQNDVKQFRNNQLLEELGERWNCNNVRVNMSGKYDIPLNGKFGSLEAFCEQEKHDGGWMVIQHRFDGSLSFDHNWTDYRNGFGEVDREHWLGLQNIYQFTKDHKCELLVEMKDFYDNYTYARYDSFGIGSEEEQYRLTTLGTYTGTAGDALRDHVGMKFSTPDRDNDADAAVNCAKDHKGGWWFKACFHAFLNGLYRNASGEGVKRIAWDDSHSKQEGLSYSRMLIRPLIPTEGAV